MLCSGLPGLDVITYRIWDERPLDVLLDLAVTTLAGFGSSVLEASAPSSSSAPSASAVLLSGLLRTAETRIRMSVQMVFPETLTKHIG